MHISVLEESVHDAQCVVATQLQQESSVIINVSITMSANHILQYTGIVPNMSIEVSQSIVDLLVLTLYRHHYFPLRIPGTMHLNLDVYLYRTRGEWRCLTTSTQTPSQWDPFINTVWQLRVKDVHPLQPGYTSLAQRRSRTVSTHRPTAQQC